MPVKTENIIARYNCLVLVHLLSMKKLQDAKNARLNIIAAIINAIELKIIFISIRLKVRLI